MLELLQLLSFSREPLSSGLDFSLFFSIPATSPSFSRFLLHLPLFLDSCYISLFFSIPATSPSSRFLLHLALSSRFPLYLLLSSRLPLYLLLSSRLPLYLLLSSRVPLYLLLSSVESRCTSYFLLDSRCTSFFLLDFRCTSFLLDSRYTEGPVYKMNEAVFSSSSLLPYSLVCNWTAVGHTFVLAVCRSGHHCNICSAVWSSRPQLQVGDRASFIFLYIWALSQLWPERSLFSCTFGH